MSETKTIYVEAKKSKNFQTYTYGETVAIEKGDDIDMVRAESQAVCRKMVVQQLDLDRR